MIRNDTVCAAAGCELIEDQGLLEEVAGLNEWPVPMLGDIWKGFRLRATREFDMAIGDFQKANMIRYPIRWHSGGFDADWAETEARSRRIMLWFFGDVFKEFAEGLPRWKALLFRVWWLFLRSGAKLRARLQSFTYSARHRFRSLRLRTLIATALRPGPTK